MCLTPCSQNPCPCALKILGAATSRPSNSPSGSGSSSSGGSSSLAHAMATIRQLVSSRSFSETSTLEQFDGGDTVTELDPGSLSQDKLSGREGAWGGTDLLHPVGSVYFNGVLCDVAGIGSRSSAGVVCSLYMAPHEWVSIDVGVNEGCAEDEAAAAHISHPHLSVSDNSAHVAHSHPPSLHFCHNLNAGLGSDVTCASAEQGSVSAARLSPSRSSELVLPSFLAAAAAAAAAAAETDSQSHQSSAASACVQPSHPPAISQHTSPPRGSNAGSSSGCAVPASPVAGSLDGCIGTKRNADAIIRNDESQGGFGRASSASSGTSKLSRASALDFSGAKMLL